MSHSPWGPKESDTSEQLQHIHAQTHTHTLAEWETENEENFGGREKEFLTVLSCLTHRIIKLGYGLYT